MSCLSAVDVSTRQAVLLSLTCSFSSSLPEWKEGLFIVYVMVSLHMSDNRPYVCIFVNK